MAKQYENMVINSYFGTFVHLIIFLPAYDFLWPARTYWFNFYYL